MARCLKCQGVAYSFIRVLIIVSSLVVLLIVVVLIVIIFVIILKVGLEVLLDFFIS